MPSLRKILFSFLALLALFAGTLSPMLAPIAAAATGGAVTADGTVPDSIPGETADQRQARLQSALDSVNKEIADNQAALASTKNQTASIQRDVAVLNLQISQAKLNIQASTITLQKLGKDISAKASTIQTLAGQIAANQQSLGNLIRKTNEIDHASLTEFVLLNQKFSDFYAELDSYDQVKSALNDAYVQISGDKQQTEIEKQTLEAKQKAESDAQAKIVANKAALARSEAEKTSLLSLSKKEESSYQSLIAAKQAKAAAIKAALFNLRDAGPIPFGTALTYAEIAQRATGVRPAFLLAILTQETNLGANVGQCYMTDDATGNGVGKNSGTFFKGVMSPTRDVPPFLQIAAKLGFDPHKQVVSCPIASAGGWGGAMGPAQFIPSTWVLYEDRITAATGHAVANPWDPEDAFAASATYLSDLGAGAGTVSSENTAAAKYYAGSAWRTKGQGYASQVAAKARAIQANIDILDGN